MHTACWPVDIMQFHFRPGVTGATGLVIIDLQGGGACSSAATCALQIWLPRVSGPPGGAGNRPTANLS